MGYSLSVSIKSTSARDQMAAFLRANTVGMSAKLLEMGVTELNNARFIHPVDDPTRSFAVCVGEQLDYGGTASRIGFNFVTSRVSRHWMYPMLSWVALRVGTKRRSAKLKKEFGVLETVPYLSYDYEYSPVLHENHSFLLDMTEEQRAYCVRLGWVVSRMGMSVFEGAETVWRRRFSSTAPVAEWLLKDKEDEKVVRAAVESELFRLDALWNRSIPDLECL